MSGGFFMKFEQFKDALSDFFFNGFKNAYEAHETIFSIEFDTKSARKQELISCSLAFLSEAYANFQSINLLIKIEDQERSEFEACYRQFITFNDELINNIKTDHSHQWTDIEFLEFTRKFIEVKNLLQLDRTDYLIEKIDGL